MAKLKNRVISALCAVSMAATLAVMPAHAELTISSDDAWNTIKTDDCSTKKYVMSRYEPFGAYVNSNYGFVYFSQHSGISADHWLGFDYGMKGNSELTFDMFIDDIDFDVASIVSSHNWWREGLDLDVFRHADNGSHNDNVLDNNTAGLQGWVNTMKTDSGEDLTIGQYATARRMYGLDEAGGKPTHIDVKVVIRDGKMTTYKKWNTESNWNVTMAEKALSKWEPADHTMIYWITGMAHISVDNVVAKYNEPPTATADREYVKAASDKVTLTFTENIETFPTELILGNKKATVAKVDDTTFTVETLALDALTTYTSDLSGFKSAKTSFGASGKLTLFTDIGDMGTTVYTVSTRDDFDGNSGIRWEKTENNIETGYTTENGVLSQTEETAETRMRKYLASDYYAEFKATVDKSVSFAMCDKDGNMSNKVTFAVEDGKISDGEYTFTSVIKDGKAVWFAANDEKTVYLGEFEADLATVARPVISSEGTGTKIDYVTVNIKADADMTAAGELNAAIEEENAEIAKRERALDAVNTASDKAAMQQALESEDLNGYADEFFTGLENEATYKTAFAEIVLNERNALTVKTFKDLEEYEKYAALALQLMKLSHNTGDALTAVLDVVSYSGIENADEDYANTKEKTADAFKAVRGSKIFMTFDEVKTVFAEAKALGVLNSAKARDEIPGIIEKYKTDLSLDLTKYDKVSAIKVAPALLEKNFESKEDVQDAIDDKIKSLNTSSGTSGGSSSGTSGGSSSGSSSNKNSNSTSSSMVIPGSSVSVSKNDTGSTVPETKGFEDLETVSWAKEAINKLAEKGIVSGVSATEYEPTRNVTRAEFVKMITESFALTANGEKSFDDVSGEAWFAKYVNIAATNGIVNGISETEFAPDNAITRQDAALIIYNCASEWAVQKDGAPADGEQIAAYAEEAVVALFRSGVVSGDEDGNFAPARAITRAEAACMLVKALEVLNKI